jgi:DNA topoisomerase-1
MVSLTPRKAKPNLTLDQYKLYNLIWQRFVASLMAECLQNTVKVDIKAVDKNADFNLAKEYCVFSASGYSVKFDGFTAVYEAYTDNPEDTGTKLPDLAEKDPLNLKDLAGNQHFTQPPARFTEASLVKALEENGVGRPSTYASIIGTITAREYVLRDGKALKPTELGEATTNLLKTRFPKFVNVKFTAQMETMLDEVSEGNTEYLGVLSEFYDDLESTLKKAKAEMEGVKIQLEEDQTDIPCDNCGKMMVIKTGKFGKFLACPGYPECKTTKPYVLETDALCPKCSGQVIQRKSKKGYVFFGCKNFPNCDFATWDQPTKEICPQCSKSLFKGKGKLKCLNEGCGYEKNLTSKKKKDEKQEIKDE